MCTLYCFTQYLTKCDSYNIQLSFLADGSISDGASAIAGGVVGALLAVAVLLILVMVVIAIVWKHYNNRKEANKGIINDLVHVFFLFIILFDHNIICIVMVYTIMHS